MAYEDATGSFVKGIAVVEEELRHARNEYTQAELALANGITTLPQSGKTEVGTALLAFRDSLKQIRDRGRTLVTPLLCEVGREIASAQVQGDTITDLSIFFRDWRAWQDGAQDEKVTAKSVTYAAEPSAGALGVLRRLTVGPRGSGDKIESGRHDKTVTARVTALANANASTITISNEDSGPVDELDYLAASPRSTSIDAVNEANQGQGIANGSMRAGGATTDGTAITVMSSWDITLASGSFAVETTLPWRSLTYSPKAGGSDGDVLLEQDMSFNVLADAYVPWWPMVPLEMEGTWTGDITIGWGNKTQAFTEADLAAAGTWRELGPDRDADLYPVNFHQASSKWSLRIETDNAVTGFVNIGGFYPVVGQKFEDVWYFYASSASYAVIQGTVTMADTSTHAGVIQDILTFLWGDDGLGAYLMTAGSNTLADPAGPEMDVVTPSGGTTALADGGTDAQGNVSVGGAAVSYTVHNTGYKPLYLGYMTIANESNVSAIADVNQLVEIPPGDSHDFSINYTISGAGAFSFTVSIVNNDASENPYNWTVSGTGV
jgi:hypothetical protein